jgi:hypothetical protein
MGDISHHRLETLWLSQHGDVDSFSLAIKQSSFGSTTTQLQHQYAIAHRCGYAHSILRCYTQRNGGWMVNLHELGRRVAI